jgi:flagellar M-ring protein FliF
VDLKQKMRDLGFGKVALFSSIVITCIVILVIGFIKMRSPNMALMYRNLDPSEAGQVVKKLESLNVKVHVEGNDILAPATEISRLRMALAEEGLPSEGGIGYELFDTQDPWGSSALLEDINHKRALEGELSRTIKGMSGILYARVHLAIPKRDLFSKDKKEPTASVLLKLSNGLNLTSKQVSAIRHFVGTAVSSLSFQNVSIVDDKGTLLASQESLEDSNSEAVIKRQRSQEKYMSESIERLIERSVGEGKVRAEVSLEMNFDNVTENSETYDPDSQVIRSSQMSEEVNQNAENTINAVTVQNTVPLPMPQPNAQSESDKKGNEPQSKSAAKKIEETTNYEISKTLKTHKREAGVVSRMSVAVIIDGTYTKDKTGKEIYNPRSKEEINKFLELVKSAVGFKEDRGDSITVVSMKFADSQVNLNEFSESIFSGQAAQNVFNLIGFIIFGACVLAGLYFGIKPLTSALFPIIKEEKIETSIASKQNIIIEDKDELLSKKESSLRKVEEVVSNYSQETVSTIRSWMRS